MTNGRSLSKMKNYRAEIDGLRTVAVIPVILFHLGYGFVKGGYMGVDVFFVISGYLITKILADDIAKDHFSMYRFWIRRVKRLLPLLLIVVLFTLIVSYFLVFKPIVKDINNDIFPAIFSYFNFHALLNFGNYWGGKSEQSFFLHTWSLSVEEQFYLIYPCFLYVAHKYFKNFLIPVLSITIVSLGLFSYYLYSSKIDSAFYMLQARMWELSIGGLVALIKFDKVKTRFNTSLLSLVGICAIGCSYFFGSETIGFFVLLPVVGTALIIGFCQSRDIVGRLLSTKAFVFVGKISYSLYLWHWPIITLFKNLPQVQHIDRHPLNALMLVLMFLFSYLTYTLIENKTRYYEHTPKLVLAGILIICGLTLYFQSGLFSPFYNSKYHKQTSYVEYYDIAPTQTILQEFLAASGNLRYDVNIPEKPQRFTDAYKKEGIIENEQNGTPQIMLIGDSHGVMWARLLKEVSDDMNVSLSCYTTNGCNPFFNLEDVNQQNGNAIYTQSQRIDYAKSITKNINKWNPKLVVLACRWDSQTEEIQPYINALLQYLENRNIKILIFTQPPILSIAANRNACQYLTYLGFEPVDGFNLMDVDSRRVIQKNDFIKSLTSKYTNVVVYDAFEHMIQSHKAKISFNKEFFYFDEDHLNYYGTSIHKEYVLPIVAQILHN